MSTKHRRARRRKASMAPELVICVTILAALALCGCAADPAGAPAGAAGPASPLLGAARAVGVATEAPVPADFVRASRPAAAPDFIPVGVTPPPRAVPKRDPAAIDKLEAELASDRDRSRAYARRPKPPSSYDGTVPKRPPAPPALRPEPAGE